jgi:hypothetical protein
MDLNGFGLHILPSQHYPGSSSSTFLTMATAIPVHALRPTSTLHKYLHEHKIQLYELKQPDNEHALLVHDLMETGGAYTWTSRAFRNFRHENYSAKTNLTDASTNQPEGAADTEDTEQDDTDIDELNETEPSSIFDLDLDAEITGEDLGLDQDTAGNVLDLSTVVQAMRENY